jgi:proteasome accessory factor A
MRAVPREEDVRRAVTQPPGTRAAVRGGCVQYFATDILAAQWDHVTLQTSGEPLRISLLDLFDPETIGRYTETLARAKSTDDLRTLA